MGILLFSTKKLLTKYMYVYIHQIHMVNQLQILWPDIILLNH